MNDLPKPSDLLKNLSKLNAKNQLEDENVLQKLLTSQKKITEAKEKKVVFSNPILYQNNNPVIFPRTINIIQGKAGVHKSRMAECICASLLKKIDYKRELLGYKAETLKQFAVCYVDTERNLTEQLPYALQQIQLKAGFEIEDKPYNFDYISLLEFDRETRFEVLDIYLDHVRKKFSIHLFVVLDVITDCIFNFNDARDSMKLIDMMNRTINKYDVTFLCLIHENPSSQDKARGHLGTELTNKASTVLQIGYESIGGKNTNLLKVSYLKCRSSAKHDPFYVEYSESERGLVLVDSDRINELEETKKQNSWQDTWCEILALHLQYPLSRKILFEKLAFEFNCSDKTFDRKLKELISNKVVFESINGQKVCLIKETKGSEIMYSLLSMDEVDCPF